MNLENFGVPQRPDMNSCTAVMVEVGDELVLSRGYFLAKNAEEDGILCITTQLKSSVMTELFVFW